LRQSFEVTLQHGGCLCQVTWTCQPLCFATRNGAHTKQELWIATWKSGSDLRLTI